MLIASNASGSESESQKSELGPIDFQKVDLQSESQQVGVDPRNQIYASLDQNNKKTPFNSDSQKKIMQLNYLSISNKSNEQQRLLFSSQENNQIKGSSSVSPNEPPYRANSLPDDGESVKPHFYVLRQGVEQDSNISPGSADGQSGFVPMFRRNGQDQSLNRMADVQPAPAQEEEKKGSSHYSFTTGTFQNNQTMPQMNQQDASLYQYVRTQMSSEREQLQRDLQQKSAGGFTMEIQTILRKLWVLDGVLELGLNRSLLLEISEKFQRIQAVPQGYFYPELFYKEEQHEQQQEQSESQKRETKEEKKR